MESHDGLAAGACDRGGGVQDAVSEPFRFRDAKRPIEAEGLCPDGDILCDQYELEPVMKTWWRKPSCWSN